MPTDMELLEAELLVLWDRDAGGRLARARDREGQPAPFVLIATTNDGYRLEFGEAVNPLTERLVRAVVLEWQRFAVHDDASKPPEILRNIEKTVRATAPGAKFESGPSYLVPEGASCDVPAEIITSAADPGAISGLVAPAEANWAVDEWRQLLAGELGPWAMAIEDSAVASICYSARWADAGAEAGAWTHPDHRGKGLAAATTAAWAGLVSGQGRLPFYSTSAENQSSQRVAERLRMRRIGWPWSWRPA